MKALVLAGGGGSRLWPLSREDFPKQFIRFDSDQSLLQKTVDRLLNASFIDEIVISTNIHHHPLVVEQIRKTDKNNRVRILIEPLRKNTGPAIAFGIKYLQEICSANISDAVLVLPSDHLIEPPSIFLNALSLMEKLVLNKKILTFGIRPTRPETGYGYIQIGETFDAGTFRAVKFDEKPEKKIAVKYLEDPNFFWNAGIFLFSIETFWEQLEKFNPELRSLFQGSLGEVVSKFSQMPNLSIDYALMEKSPDILVYPLAVSWSDVGSWDSIYETMDKDENQNVQIGNVVSIDTKNSLIFGGKRLISTVGLEDMLIVATEDATFISKKGESQKVKEVVQRLIQIGSKEGTSHPTQSFPWGIVQVMEEGKECRIEKVVVFGGESWALPDGATGIILEGKGRVDGRELCAMELVQGGSELFVPEGLSLILVTRRI